MEYTIVYKKDTSVAGGVRYKVLTDRSPAELLSKVYTAGNGWTSVTAKSLNELKNKVAEILTPATAKKTKGK